MSVVALVGGAVQAVGFEGGDRGAIGRGVHFAAGSEEAQRPVFEGESGGEAAKEGLFIGGIVAPKAVVAILGFGGDGASGGRIIVAYDEPLAEGGLEVAQSKGAQRAEVLQYEVGRIVIVAFVDGVGKGFAGVFFCGETGLDAVVEVVGIADRVAKGFAQVAPCAAVGSGEVTAFPFQRAVVFHDPFAVSAVQQVAWCNGQAPRWQVLHADEGCNALAVDPVEAIDGSQFVGGEKRLVSPTVGEDRIYLCVGEKGDLVEVVSRGCVQVDRVLGQLR